jgi:hypothetical protein
LTDSNIPRTKQLVEQDKSLVSYYPGNWSIHKLADQFNADEPSQIGGEDALNDDIGLD